MSVDDINEYIGRVDPTGLDPGWSALRTAVEALEVISEGTSPQVGHFKAENALASIRKTLGLKEKRDGKA